MLNAAGKQLAQSILGNSFNFDQTLVSLGVSTTTATADLSCPRPKTFGAAIDYKSITLLQSHMVRAIPCPSDLIVSEPALDTADPKVKAAIAKLDADPRRSGKPNAGYDWDLNQYVVCPQEPTAQFPGLAFSYDKNQGTITATYDRGWMSGNTPPYCDLVGGYTEEVIAQDTTSGSSTGAFRNIGGRAIHKDGLREILIGATYGLPASYGRESLTLPVGKFCRDAATTKTTTRVRVELVEQFTADQSQRFQSIRDYTYPPMRNGRGLYYSPAKEVC